MVGAPSGSCEDLYTCLYLGISESRMDTVKTKLEIVLESSPGGRA